MPPIIANDRVAMISGAFSNLLKVKLSSTKMISSVNGSTT